MSEVETAPKKRRASSGTRAPQPIYVFVGKNEEGRLVANAAFRNPRKMAERMQNNRDANEDLLIVTPE